ncbi:MAG: hypothetical protein AAF721_29285 [Myxococcota bacterium]
MDDRAYERKLHAKAVRFGFVLCLTGLLSLGAAVALFVLDFDARPKLSAAGVLIGIFLVFEGGRRVWLGRAPEVDYLEPNYDAEAGLHPELDDDALEQQQPPGLG